MHTEILDWMSIGSNIKLQSKFNFPPSPYLNYISKLFIHWKNEQLVDQVVLIMVGNICSHLLFLNAKSRVVLSLKDDIDREF